MKIVVTGGAGFIGSALSRYIINNTSHKIIVLDCLTYAGNLESLKPIENNKQFIFEKVDICNKKSIKKVLDFYKPDAVMHLAAESHVDNSIENPDNFINTNIIGTYNLLTECYQFWGNLPISKKSLFRFHHISTDEVYGDLPHPDDTDGVLPKFDENTPYNPSSPYSASKACSDHLVRAWYRTYKLPILITNCSNNYGQYQYPEKFIPKMILNALNGKDLTVYGNGRQIRDWLYVDDHVEALFEVLISGKVGHTYNIGGDNEKTNLEVLTTICSELEKLLPIRRNANLNNSIHQYSDLIKFVDDRPGHDKRYAIDAYKIRNELGWKPKESFETGLYKTIEWYLNNDSN